jgi:membrane-associated phospholipid phosphatase
MKKSLLAFLLLAIIASGSLTASVSDKTYFRSVLPKAYKPSFVLPALGGGIIGSLVLSHVETNHRDFLYGDPFLPDFISHTCDRYIAEYWFIPISLAGALLEGYGNNRYYEPLRHMAVAHSMNLGLTYALKWGIGRIRPDGTPLSFPSGHTSISFTTATIWANWHGAAAGIPMYTLAVLTALSRINDKRHWPADIFFGAILGTVTARALYVAEKNEKEEMVFIQTLPLIEIRFSTADWDR